MDWGGGWEVKKQKCENRGGQRRMTTSTCPNLQLSLRAFLSPCDGQSWWCPVREREGETERGRVTAREASVMTGLPPFLFLYHSLFFPPLWLFLSFASSYPIMHPLDISGQQSVPGSDRGSGPSVTQSPMSSLVFLVFFSFVYTMTQVKVVLQFTLDENWIVNSTYSVVLFNFYCWCITL